MSNKKVSKSPFGKYTVDEVIQAEAGNYVIQVGDDLFTYNGKMAFSRQRAEMFYDDIIAGLNDMKKNGSKIEREDAVKCLLLLRMLPFRIQ